MVEKKIMNMLKQSINCCLCWECHGCLLRPISGGLSDYNDVIAFIKHSRQKTNHFSPVEISNYLIQCYMEAFEGIQVRAIVEHIRIMNLTG